MASSGPSDGRSEERPLVATFFEKRDNLLLFLAARTRCMATAEDLVQELYLKLLTADAVAADVRSPSALLYRMASNLLIDHVRSTQRASRREGQWRFDGGVVTGREEVVDEPAADEVVIAKERARQLAEAVADLPPKMGQAFRLHKLEGLSQAQTAQRMGVSAKMIEQHIQAAIKNLAQKLRS